MTTLFRVSLVALLVAPAGASAQASHPFEPLDESTQRPPMPTPVEVEALETREGVPPCGDQSFWGRSVLDGGLASRRRPDDLPCRSVWQNTVRVELGLLAGTLTDRGDGSIGGLTFSLGLRYHELFSIYYSLHLMGGAWERPRDLGVAVAATMWNSLLLEVRPHPIFGFAAGPSFDITAECDPAIQGDQQCWYAWSYGVSTRLTLALFEVDDVGVTMTGDFHVSLIEPTERATGLAGLGLRF